MYYEGACEVERLEWLLLVCGGRAMGCSQRRRIQDSVFQDLFIVKLKREESLEIYFTQFARAKICQPLPASALDSCVASTS